MRIFQIITLSDLGGAQSVLINLVNFMVLDDRHEIHVISSTGGEMWDNLSSKVVKHKLASLNRQISFSDFSVCLSLKSLYSKHNPDIIHLHSSKIGTIGRLVFPSYKIIYTVHGFSSLQLANRRFLFIEKLLQKRTAAIIGVSLFDKKEMMREGIFNNVSVIYNGTSQKNLNLDNQGILLFRQMEMQKKEGYKIVLSIARLSKQKNFRLFNDVAKVMYLDKIIFLWIGNNYQPNFEISSNIILGGEINNAQVFNKIADIFILTSNYEGLPMSVIEAQSYGVPVVASNVGGVSEILNNTNGAAVENNIIPFVEKIRHFLQPNNHKIAKEESLKIHREKFELDVMCEKYLHLFTKIVKKNYLNVK